MSTYPLVPGHEIVGIVKEIGDEVTKFRVGDSVGIGCLVDSCRECENCKQDLEQYRLNGASYTYFTPEKHGDGIIPGGYSDQIVCDQDFVLKVADHLPLERVAPLLCAGITTYSPLRPWKVGKGRKVAVIGLGGLGHMGVKLAAAMGAEVTVLSTSASKQADAIARHALSHQHLHSPVKNYLRPMKAHLIKRLLYILLFASGTQLCRAQQTYLDSLQSWRKNYIETHELLKTPEQRSLLRFFPLSADYRVNCSFERLPDSAWFPMQTSGNVKTARKYGRLTFKVHDTTMHLIVFQLQMLLAKPETRDYLFVGFTDVTSAVESYGAGRYIDCVIGDIHHGRMELDFNKAYNPYCAYTSGYNCPIPPKENDLPVAILAGEKNYAGGKTH